MARVIDGWRPIGWVMKTKPIRVSFNMFCCATLFCWAGVLPRETISGLFGRKVGIDADVPYHRIKYWRAGMAFIDRLHPHEEDHCVETAECERRMREELYKCMPG